MDKSNITITLLVLIFAVVAAMGQNPTATPTKDLSSLSWLAGNWSGAKNGIEMEENWTIAKGNTMLGLHRDVKGGRTLMFEFLRIDAKPDGITYWASPGGRPATPFKLIESRSNYAAFENKEHDFPNRIIYWLVDDSLHAKIEGTMNGKPASEEWVWKKE